LAVYWHQSFGNQLTDREKAASDFALGHYGYVWLLSAVFSCAYCVTVTVLFLLQRKLLAIYLHHDQSIFANVFCSQVLCAESLVSFLSANFYIWAWDLTHASNREKYVQLYIVFYREVNILYLVMFFRICNSHEVMC